MMRWRIDLISWQWAAVGVVALTIAGCGTAPTVPPPASEPTPARQTGALPVLKPSSGTPVLPPAGSGRGGYYQDDGPGEKPPEGLQAIPDAEPKVEPYSSKGNRPYVVFGKTYTPITDNRPLVQRGVGSWYGKKFHGQRTSSGELYDMYKMSAAHPTLPIPSYARVTNLSNGAQVIVRVNDRGPFHSSRIIDLSYTAALKLGYLGKGSSELQVERLLPDEIERIAANRNNRSQLELASLSNSGSPPVVSVPAVSQATPDDIAERNAILAGFSDDQKNPAEMPGENAKATAPPQVSATFADSNFYLQLGAFGDAANAEAAQIRLRQSMPAGFPSIEIVQSGILYRLYCGPFLSRNKAAEAAQQLDNGASAKALIVQR